MAKQSLVIVESPAKAKTIGKYLGKDYEVKACMGHLRDLQKSKLSVDVDNDFEPVYKPIKGKEAIISDLKKSAKAADTVYLATDPDREGEAISWHLKSLLDLPDKKQSGSPSMRSRRTWSARASKIPGTSTRIWWMPSRPAYSGPAGRLSAQSPAVEEDQAGPVRRTGPVCCHPNGG